MQVVWYSFDGVFGGPISVVVTLILVFVVFGVVLEGIGAGPVLLNFAFAFTGRSRGGPAHAAIVASGIFGTMSGSVSGNVVGTGVMTIPMIVKRGFPPRYAGGVEAAASSGGQFMPPIMGAVAFIMSDVTGIPYLTICIGALLPALFYYGSLFVAVHLEAVKRGIKPIPAGGAPSPDPLRLADVALLRAAAGARRGHAVLGALAGACRLLGGHRGGRARLRHQRGAAQEPVARCSMP